MGGIQSNSLTKYTTDIELQFALLRFIIEQLVVVILSVIGGGILVG